MKSNITVFSIVLFLLVIIMFVSCGKQKTEWRGMVEEEDGVTVVKNPNEPLYGDLVFDLEEDLSIGREDDDNYVFFRIVDIEVDGDENIYVLEYGNKRVQKFDREGNYLCTIGREGQGPGEFQMPREMLVDDKTGIVGIRDMRKLVVFDKDGNYLNRDVPLKELVTDMFIDSEGVVWGINFAQEETDDIDANYYKVLVKLDSEGHVEKKVASFSYDIYTEAMGDGVMMSTSGEEYDLSISKIGERNIVYGYSKEYELNIIDMEGNMVSKIIKDEPHRDFTAGEKQKQKRAKFPEYKPFFYSLFSDNKGRIYVQRNKARRTENVDKEFDIFSKDGYYLYRTVCPLTPFVVTAGFFYTRVENEDTGEVFVKRYKIKNWDKIKEGI